MVEAKREATINRKKRGETCTSLGGEYHLRAHQTGERGQDEHVRKVPGDRQTSGDAKVSSSGSGNLSTNV